MEKNMIRLYNSRATGYLEFEKDIMCVYALLSGQEESAHDAHWRATVVRRNEHGLVMRERPLALQEKSIEGLTKVLGRGRIDT